jgi:uncharacterized protein
MLRVVLDTNVLISALNITGKPARVVELAIAGVIQNVTSAHILGKLREILARKFAWETKMADRAANLVRSFSTLVEPKQQLNAVAHEPDNRILECAAAGRVHFIIAGNRHLTGLAAFQGIHIIGPAAFLEMFETS